MVTIRELGEKYGGIISEFVARCDDEGRDCETEKSESEMFNTLISSLRNNELLTEKQASYSCSEKLYNEVKERVEKKFEKKICVGDVFGVATIYSNWKSILDDQVINRTYFHISCQNGHLQLAKWLLEVRPDIDVRSRDDFIFRTACENGHLEVVKWLLEVRPDIDVRASDDHAFRSACGNGYLEVAKWVFGIRPDIDVFGLWERALRNSQMALKYKARY